jgi:predicted histidine transporter YuiF (NhaC family)
LLHQIQHKETLVVGNMVVAALIEVVAEVVQVVLDNLVPVHILLMPLVVRDLLLQ